MEGPAPWMGRTGSRHWIVAATGARREIGAPSTSARAVAQPFPRQVQRTRARFSQTRWHWLGEAMVKDFDLRAGAYARLSDSRITARLGRFR